MDYGPDINNRLLEGFDKAIITEAEYVMNTAQIEKNMKIPICDKQAVLQKHDISGSKIIQLSSDSYDDAELCELSGAPSTSDIVLPVSSTPISSTLVSSTPVSSTPISSTPVSSTPDKKSPLIMPVSLVSQNNLIVYVSASTPEVTIGLNVSKTSDDLESRDFVAKQSTQSHYGEQKYQQISQQQQDYQQIPQQQQNHYQLYQQLQQKLLANASIQLESLLDVTERTQNVKGSGRKRKVSDDDLKWARQDDFIILKFSNDLTVKKAESTHIECDIKYGNFLKDQFVTLNSNPLLINFNENGPRANLTKESITPILGLSVREKYSKDLTVLAGSIKSIMYVRNAKFSLIAPYQPEWFRYETRIDQLNQEVKIDRTKCALCPYCKSIEFQSFGNGSYSKHLSKTHGILSNNFIIPEAINFGMHDFGPKSKIHKGVECPQCHKSVKIFAKKGAPPLTCYFDHYSSFHKNCKEGSPVPIVNVRDRR